MFRLKYYSLLTFFTALVLISETTVYGGAELILAHDFRMSELREMPRSTSGFDIKYIKKSYLADNAIEWQVRLRRSASGKSILYQNVNSADFKVRFPSTKRITLHWSEGSHSHATDFRPREQKLVKSKPFKLESFGGRSSDGVMPYFNISTPEGGLIVAIGWSGDWKASFELLADGRVRITTGLKHSRFRLQAGEQLRLPSVLLMAYQGNWIDGQNQFRRLMLKHFTPTNHHPMKLMPVAASVHGQIGFNDTTEEKLKLLATDIAALKLPLDTFWLDAGWNEGGFPLGQGNPNADSKRFPHGLKPIGKELAKTEMRFLAWFEPERVMRGTWLDKEHPEWLLFPSQTPTELRYMENDGFRLLNLGNAKARRWILNSISEQIQKADVSVYRQDFNAYPAFFWHTNEPPDEVGLREIRYISGLYDLLDKLAQQHPDLILDNCASGGRRLDFEMMRRCVVLWRSDNCWDDKSYPRNAQAMTHGLSLWLPLHGLGAHTTNAVSLRSGMGTCGSFPINFQDPAAVTALRKHLKQYLKVRPLFAADFYPLTTWSNHPTGWLAFQFHDAEKNEGIVQAFCGAGTAQSYTLKLQALCPNTQYTITDWDHPKNPLKRSGLKLNRDGIRIPPSKGNQAVVFHYTAAP